jgi:hypothetical protein
MSIPESITYKKLDIATAIRFSELEPFNLNSLSNDKEIKKIWLDSFTSDWWIDEIELLKSLKNFQIFIVSPELHGRDPEKVWSISKNLLDDGLDVSICTDQPEKVAKIWGKKK